MEWECLLQVSFRCEGHDKISDDQNNKRLTKTIFVFIGKTSSALPYKVQDDIDDYGYEYRA
jgi:hypothetical protein